MSRGLLIYLGSLILLSAAVGIAVWWYPSTPTPAPEAPGKTAIREARATPSIVPAPVPTPPRLPAGVRLDLVDITKKAGIDFKHVDGRTEMQYLMDSTGSGVAWIDFDQDGLLDLFLVQGHEFAHPYKLKPQPCKFYRNLGNGKFEDITTAVGLDHVGCGQGAAVGDFDNDGFPDLFLTCYGKPNVLYHNVPQDGKPGRRFQDITTRAGLGKHEDWKSRPNWSTSAAFLDYDNDGKLDLFVCSYVKADPAHYPDCLHPDGRRGPCSPHKFQPTRCLIYRNQGNGTFTDVSRAAGIDEPTAKALGVVALDFDDDGHIDLFVANDGVPNFFFRNRGNGTFESVALVSGCAVNLVGTPQAYMGVDADDLHGNGRPDLFVTAFSRETNSLFRNEGGGQFLEVTRGSGLGPPSWFRLAFGTAFLDLDRDGSLDIVVINGHVARYVDDDGDPNITFKEQSQLFLNNGKGQFQEVSTVAGSYFQEFHVGRGVALGDFDNDGHMDLAITNSGEEAVLLHNKTTTPNSWLRLELQGTKSNRDAVGAKVSIRIGDRTLVRHRKGGASYLSAHDPRLLIGLGPAKQADEVQIRWPSGLVQKVGPLAAGRGYRIIEGKDGADPRP